MGGLGGGTFGRKVEDRPKWLQESLDSIGVLVERGNQRLALDNLALAERYLEGELRVLVHFVEFSEGDFVERCAVFERKQPVGGFDRDGVVGNLVSEVGREYGAFLFRHGVERLPHELADVHPETAVGATDRNDEAVLIAPIKFMELPEQVVPASVGLCGPDEFDRLVTNAVYFSQTFGFKLSGAIRDRESVLGSGFDLVGSQKLVDEQVEGRSQVMDDVAKGGPPAEWRIGKDVDCPDPLFGLRVVVGSDFVGAFFPEVLDLRLQILDVLFGPFDFRPRPV
jgi:hypothetical protein